MPRPDAAPPLGLYAQLACIWEATARKPGNVHRYYDFDDVNYLDFLVSAAAIAPVMAEAPKRPVSETVLKAIRATKRVTTTNTNLGIVLLLAPLAAIPEEIPETVSLRQVLKAILIGLDEGDAATVYQAIRLAAPAGLGEVSEQDVRDEPTLGLKQIMALAADRDLIARQYVNDFAQIFDEGVPALQGGLEITGELERAIIFCQLHLMAAHPDSLIQRKRGRAEAEEAAQRARHVLDSGWPPVGNEPLRELDGWLREFGHQRNPGTTADLVTASLFVALRQGIIKIPGTFSGASLNSHE